MERTDEELEQYYSSKFDMLIDFFTLNDFEPKEALILISMTLMRMCKEMGVTSQEFNRTLDGFKKTYLKME